MGRCKITGFVDIRVTSLMMFMTVVLMVMMAVLGRAGSVGRFNFTVIAGATGVKSGCVIAMIPAGC